MTTDDEIRTMLRDVGVRDATADQVRAVRELSDGRLIPLPTATRALRGADPDANPLATPPGPLRRVWHRIVDALEQEQRERDRYRHASPEIREAYLAGYAHGLIDARLIR